jgi:polyhydroxybutyrate depolymerase
MRADLRAVALAGLALLLTGAACKARPGAADAGPAPSGSSASPAPSSRPYGLHLPAAWDRAHPAPLVLFFHGYGGTGATAAALLHLQDLSDARGFVLAFPDGTLDRQARRFWNATNACCDFEGRQVDDVAYASWIIDDVAGKVPIDRKRVYAMGHSNGGFLALRLACDLAPRIAAAVSLAGAGWKDDRRCQPSEPVSVLQVQGDADPIVHIDGGVLFDRATREYPGALATVTAFAIKDHCPGELAPVGPPFDFDLLEGGKETTPSAYAGCPPGISVMLWTVAGGSHFPSPTPDGLNALWVWMAAHPKP